MPNEKRQLDLLVRRQRVPSDVRCRNLQMMIDVIHTTSPCLKDGNFERIHPDDLELLFELYDEYFFDNLIRKSLPAKLLTFRISRRMTSVGGTTTRWPAGGIGRSPRFEIAVSSTLLFQSFQDPERKITVTGLECDHRLDALMRVFEHELVHLLELFLWEDSSCSLHRFQSIANLNFGHTDHRHDLLTPSEAAYTQFGIRPGVRVRFRYEGKELYGVVNRVTKRATVLVRDPSGRRYSDGNRYSKFYIPVSNLEVLQ